MGQTFRKTVEYLDQLGKLEGSIVEIGSSRKGDDQSTQFFYELSKQLSVDFVTCDINEEIISGLHELDIPAVCQKGEDFLKSYNKPIGIVYLDNFDWNWRPMATEDWTWVQINEYRDKYDMEMTNLTSAVTHLTQAIIVETKTTSNSLIVIDDTWFEHGRIRGRINTVHRWVIVCALYFHKSSAAIHIC